VAAKLRPDEPGTHSVRRIARQRIKSALRALPPGNSDDESVHEARKDLKRARATLRLLREALGKATYRRENAAIRDAARPLSEVRDGRVLLDALSSLVKYYGRPASDLPLAEFKRVLNRRRLQMRNQILKRPAPLRAVRKALGDVQSRSKDWHVGRRGWSIIGAGVKRTYSQARRALKQARATPTDVHLHELRKQTKYFWHQIQILEPLWPGQLNELADEAHRVADLLGDDHDLAVLRTRVLGTPEAFPTEASHKALLALLDRCRDGLQGKGLALAQRLYDERPAAFTARLGKYWHDWRRS
jgi:CHAD domain-containing protein